MWTLATGLFVVAYGTNVSTPFLVLYKDRLGLGSSETMAIFAVYVVGILGTLLVAGPLSDRFGRRPVVLPMVLLSALGSAFMIAGRDEFGLLLAGRFLLGIASGGALGVGAAWLQEVLGPGKEQRAAVMTTVVTFAGFGVGPPISALFYWLFPAPLVLPFLLHIAVTLVTFVLLLPQPETHRASPGAKIRISLGVPRSARRSFSLVIVPAAVWVFAFPSSGFALFPVLISDSIDGGEVAVAAVAGALTAWAGLAARPLVTRVGPRVALPIGMVMGTTGYVCGTMAFAFGVWPLVLVASPLLGGASGAITAGCLTLLGGMADKERRGALTSTFYLLAYPGMALPLFITTLAADTSMTSALILVTATGSLSTVFVAAMARSGPVSVGVH